VTLPHDCNVISHTQAEWTVPIQLCFWAPVCQITHLQRKQRPKYSMITQKHLLQTCWDSNLRVMILDVALSLSHNALHLMSVYTPALFIDLHTCEDWSTPLF